MNTNLYSVKWVLAMATDAATAAPEVWEKALVASIFSGIWNLLSSTYTVGTMGLSSEFAAPFMPTKFLAVGLNPFLSPH
jgi:hypothetical protein